jgi:EAL domain-containing protein (putative c-di-GMP-specific phosphodiesterase class I)
MPVLICAWLASTRPGGGLEQSSVFHVQGDRIDVAHLQQCADMLATTSPNVLLYAAMDGWRRQMVQHGHDLLDAALRRAASLREELAALDGIDVMHDELLGEQASHDLDELQVVLDLTGLNISGYTAADWLRDQHALDMGTSDHRRIGVQLSYGDDPAALDRLTTALAGLVKSADTLPAVYRAKAAGRGRAEVFDDSLRRELSERANLETALIQAIGHDELLLHYQPIVNISTGAVEGYEALVRWQRPGVGLVAPAQFIAAAEATDLICDLDAWVLTHACNQLAAWTTDTDTPHLTMAVNISGRHVSNPRILTDITTALTTSGIPARQLVLEITETVLIDGVHAIDHLTALRAIGVAISIDDFGTGYNSIARLQHLPIDILKIDKMFLDTSHDSCNKLLQLMIQAAHAFGLPVIAEGVEHRHQLETLRALHCESAQGFYLGRPAPADDTTLHRDHSDKTANTRSQHS